MAEVSSAVRNFVSSGSTNSASRLQRNPELQAFEQLRVSN
jgi:hypothetical protein